MRVLKAFSAINVTKWYYWINKTYLEYTISSNELFFKDPRNIELIKLTDYSHIGEFLMFHNILKGLRIFLVIACTCYFFAMFFKIILVGEEDFLGHITLSFCDNAGGYFEACNESW